MSESPGDDLPQRNNPSAGVHIDLGHSSLVLLTVTTADRAPWLANADVNGWLHRSWMEADAWHVGDYLLMPDHLHVFCAPSDLNFGMETWIAYWKRLFALKHGNRDWKFQSRGWHHRLRNGESYSDKWRYVQENPVRKGLVSRVEDWPFKGHVFDLVWTGG